MSVAVPKDWSPPKLSIKLNASAEAICWQPEDTLLICKQTFSIATPLPVLLKAEPIWLEDEITVDGELTMATDIVPPKSRFDVVLVGKVYCDSERQESIFPRLAVPPLLEKTLELVAVPSDDDRGEVVLTYRITFGGPGDLRNPVGVSDQASAPLRIRYRSGPDDKPAGFGPISPRWLPRVALAPETGWDPSRWNEAPLPSGLDRRYFNSAPEDQQIALSDIPASLSIELDHLHHVEEKYRTSLVVPRVRARWPNGKRDMVCDTLVIDTEVNTATFVMRALVTRSEMSGVNELILEGIVADHPRKRTEGVDRDAAARPAIPFHPSSETPAVEVRTSAPAHGLPWQAELPPGTTPAGASAPPTSAQPPAVVGVQPRAPAVEHLSLDRPSAPQTSASALFAAPIPVPGGGTVGDAHAAVPTFMRRKPEGLVLPEANSTRPLEAPKSVQELSDEAARAQAQTEDASMARRATSASAVSPAVRGAHEIVEVLWFDPAVLARARRNPEWGWVFQAAEKEAVDPYNDGIDGHLPTFGVDAMDVEDHRDIASILTMALPANGARMNELVDAAVRSHGRFSPPLCVCSGDLQLHWDEVGHLQALATALMPVAVDAEDPLQGPLAATRDLFSTSWALPSVDLLRAIRKRFEKAFSERARSLTYQQATSPVETALFAAGRFDQRVAFGGPQLYTTFSTGDGYTLPAYLPADLTRLLPRQRKFSVRLLANLHSRPDLGAASSSHLVLRVRAIALTSRGQARVR